MQVIAASGHALAWHWGLLLESLRAWISGAGACVLAAPQGILPGPSQQTPTSSHFLHLDARQEEELVVGLWDSHSE